MDIKKMNYVHIAEEKHEVLHMCVYCCSKPETCNATRTYARVLPYALSNVGLFKTGEAVISCTKYNPSATAQKSAYSALNGG